MSNSVFREEYDDESGGGKLSRKAKDSPFMVFGLAGLAAVCGIGIYKYQRRGTMSTSVFLMQLRVAAQGTVVGALSLGLAYTMAQKYIFHSPEYMSHPAVSPHHDHQPYSTDTTSAAATKTGDKH